MAKTTVTGNIHDVTDAPRRVPIVFTPTYSAKAEGTNLVTTTKPTVITAAADGAFTVDLIDGNYTVKIDADTFTIAVPVSGPVNIKDIIQ